MAKKGRTTSAEVQEGGAGNEEQRAKTTSVTFRAILEMDDREARKNRAYGQLHTPR